jgi:FAD/FMN-containing dehydrogenase
VLFWHAHLRRQSSATDDRIFLTAMERDPTLIDNLRRIVGNPYVLVDDDLTGRYRVDWTGRFRASTAIVVRPANSEEVAAIISACRSAGAAIVPQGGNTGLVGGSVPLSGEIVVSTERLNEIEYIDPTAGEAVVQAGVTLGRLREDVARHGWEYAVDIASRDSATVGGTVATNAGGLRVLRYGDTRRQVLGVELVTGAGTIVSSLRRTKRDNTGYHLPSMVAGSEGTLGILTRVRLRLVARHQACATSLIRLRDISQAAVAAELLGQATADIESVELFLGEGLELVCRVFDLPLPFSDPSGAYVLVEAASDHDDVMAPLAAAVNGLDGVLDVAVAETPSARRRLWRYRELHTEAIATLGVPHKLDVALPSGALAEFVGAVSAVVERDDPDTSCWLFGHGGESTIHVNLIGPAPDDFRLDAVVFELVARMGGSISAEHGIGRAKLPWIGLARNPDELELLASVKEAFDPDRVLNPNVLLAAQGEAVPYSPDNRWHRDFD